MQEDHAIALLKGGDLAGLKELVGRYQVEAVHCAYLILGDRQTAEDMAQTAFLKVAERIRTFKDGRPFRPWFMRIVTNEALKVAMDADKRVSLEGKDERDAAASWLLDANPGPEQLVDNLENRRKVWQALQQLTPKQRSAVVMRYYLDMRDREIAIELSRSLSSIKWSLHAARKRLRELLGTEPDEAGSRATSASDRPDKKRSKS